MCAKRLKKVSYSVSKQMFYLAWLSPLILYNSQSLSYIHYRMNTTPRCLYIESMVFRKHYSDLQASVQTPSELASILYSKGIISRHVRNKAQLLSLTVDEKNHALFNAVEQAIFSDPQCFHQLMDIFADEPATKPLHIKMMNTYCELVTNNVHLYSTY